MSGEDLKIVKMCINMKSKFFKRERVRDRYSLRYLLAVFSYGVPFVSGLKYYIDY